MNFLEQLLYNISGKMDRPVEWDWFHILCLAICIIGVFLLCKYCKNANDRQVTVILLVFSVVSIVLEVLWQTYASFSYDGISVSWKYQIYNFPFQFCSTPMYVAFIAALSKPGSKFRDSLIAYLATFGMLGGFLVMIMPDGCFTTSIFCNIQTMIHHGSQFFVGAYLLICSKFRQNWRTITGGASVFIALAGIALAMDLIYYKLIFPTTGETFNMFFISPYFESGLAIYNQLYPAYISYSVYLILYFIPFIGSAYGIYAIKSLIKRIFAASQKKIEEKKEHNRKAA